MSYRKSTGIRRSRILARKAIRAAERAALKGVRPRSPRVGPNWKSGKFQRDVPDGEAIDRFAGCNGECHVSCVGLDHCARGARGRE